MLQKYFKSIIRNAHANNLLFGLGKDFNIYLTFVGKFPHVGKIAQISLDPPTMFKRVLCLRGWKLAYYV